MGMKPARVKTDIRLEIAHQERPVAFALGLDGKLGGAPVIH